MATKSKQPVPVEMPVTDPAMMPEPVALAEEDQAIVYDENNPLDMLKQSVNEMPDQKDGIGLVKLKSEAETLIKMLEQPYLMLRKLGS